MSNDDFYALAVFASGFVTNPASGSVASFVSNSILASDIIANRIAFVLIDPTKDNYFYKKEIKVKDLTSFKLYMKETI